MKKTFLLLSLSCLLFIAVPAFAQTEYTLLQPIPLNGADGGETGATTASKYISGVFKLLIGIAGVLAVVMIIVGGIKYMSTDAFQGKNDAKGTIQNALLGFLLALSAWIILSTIDKRLVEFNLNIERVPPPTSVTEGGTIGGSRGILPGYKLTPEEVALNKQIRDSLMSKNVYVNSGPCAEGETRGCTNLVKLPQKAIDGAIDLAKKCDCMVNITGGAEGGHATHGPGIANIDISISGAFLNDYITEKGEATNASCGIRNAPKYSLNGAIYTDEGDHWHVCY